MLNRLVAGRWEGRHGSPNPQIRPSMRLVARHGGTLVYHLHYLYQSWPPCERRSSQAGQPKKPSLEGA